MTNNQTEGERMREGHATPWGAAQTVREIVPGIENVTTAGHGGIHLDQAHANKIPAEIVKASWLGKANWWEEDCDWCVPFVIFEEEIKEKGDEHSKMVIKEGFHTDAYKRLTA